MKAQTTSFIAIKPTEHFTEEEEMGKDAPFMTFSWEHWLEMQTRTLHCFARFQRAVAQMQPIISHQVVLEMHEVVRDLHGITLEMQKEAGELIGISPIPQSPL
jgi:hypothetical protein